MRILTITSDPNAGGSSLSLLNLLRGLKHHRHEILVVIPKRGFLSQSLESEGIRYSIVPFIRSEVWPRTESIKDYILLGPKLLIGNIYYFLSKYKIGKLMKIYNPDIIHTNVSLCSIGYDLSKDLNIKHVWHIREYGDLDFNLKHFPSNKTFRNKMFNSYTIAISKGLKEHYDLGTKCQIIYNGIRTQNYLCSNQKKDNYILFVGRVDPCKGVSELINAYVKYRKKGGNKRLLIAGTGRHAYKSELIDTLRNNNIETDVIFLGQRKDVDKLMQKACVLVVPSKYEAFGRITAEAMFNNCLVVGKNTGGTREQIELGAKVCNREIAYLYDDEKQLTEILLKIDSLNKSEYNEMVTKANKYVKEYYSNEKNIEETEKYFKEIITQK